MNEHEFLSEKNKKPTYTPMEVLRMLHDKDLDKHSLLQIIELLQAEGGRYDIKDFRIISWNLRKRQKKVQKKMMEDARNGIYSPIRQMKDVLPGEKD